MPAVSMELGDFTASILANAVQKLRSCGLQGHAVFTMFIRLTFLRFRSQIIE
jgi:hypothetical protein